MESLQNLFFVLLCLAKGSLCIMKDRNEIVSDLLQRASVQRVPSVDDQPVKVTVRYSLLNIQKADPANNVVDILAWLKLSWTDKSLSWPKECTPFKDVSVASDKIWTPDIAVFNSIGAPDVYSSNHVRVSKNGNVLQMKKLHVQLPCNITPDDSDRSDYESTCGLRMGSWTMGTQELLLEGDGVEASLDDYFPGSMFEVLNATQRINKRTYAIGQDIFENAELVFTFKASRLKISRN